MRSERPVVTQSPENSETPLPDLRSWVTPNRLFFVRNHFAEPELDERSWRLRVHGQVRVPREWSWRELQELSERTVFATMECAGNGRSFLHPVEPGIQWGSGAVGHAEWTGVPLAAVLEHSGLLGDALEILCEGADVGTEPDHPEPMRFVRGLPLLKALHPDTLIAFRMNGEPLTPSHGAPARLIVPGWYGVCSVKWLTRIEVLNRAFEGYFQTSKYTIREADGRDTRMVKLTRMAVKSEIIRPAPEAELQPGVNRITGLAWGGEAPVDRVDLSTDGGRTWTPATLVGPRAPYSWTMWEHLWHVERPGEYRLASRATSASGESQPSCHDPLRGGYVINFVRAHPVRVASTGRSQETWGDATSRAYGLAHYAEREAQRHLDLELDSEFTDGAGI